MEPTARELIAKLMADKIGHGMEEKYYGHADFSVIELKRQQPQTIGCSNVG